MIKPKIYYMDIFDHKIIILRWINSCDRPEQLDLLTVFINGFVITKFEKEIEEMRGDADKKVLKYDLEATKFELADAIQGRKLMLPGGNINKPEEYDIPDDPDGIHNYWW